MEKAFFALSLVAGCDIYAKMHKLYLVEHDKNNNGICMDMKWVPRKKLLIQMTVRSRGLF